MNGPLMPPALDATDRAIIVATQRGLPLAPRPYHAVGDGIGIPGAEVIARIERMLATGAIRRIGAVPNHYALGYGANGMSVWDVADERIGDLGPAVGALPFVTHCYERMRHPPAWPFNLFAMVHGRSRGEVEDKVAQIAAVLDGAARSHAVLYSVRILKKSGLRLQER
jgi:DNA-binding Lrp family transcriptional regulator